MDSTATRPGARTAPIPVAQETLEALRERLHRANESVETRISMLPTRMSRFPHRLRGIGGTDSRYVVPSVVAIGPYHHGRPHLQEMEEVKHAAAYRLCRDSGRSVEEVYAKVFSVAGDARRCYDDDGALLPLGGGPLSDAEFATMMFVDGCFLVWFIHEEDALTIGCYFSSGPSIYKDIHMLENQIPWLVLESLMEFRPVDAVNWIDNDVAYFFYRKETKVRPWRLQRLFLVEQIVILVKHRRRLFPRKEKNSQTDTSAERNTNTSSHGDGDHSNMPPHLLGLLRFRMISGMPPKKRSSASGDPSFLSRSAVDLAQIGVKLTASTRRAGWFVDMNVQPVFAELSLLPLLLDHVNACRLVNMAALEATEAFAASTRETDGYVVSSYLSTLAMLMDREEDVHELRRRGVLSSNFSNAETLAFFKGLGQHLRLGKNYTTTLREIDDYVRRRPVRIAVHKFIYNNYRVIAALLSVAGVLASILKALYSLKKP
ncbi:unnamed protein product [Urochloa decumbens]|uniref:Uncharacterized protein n=1 Tax=Urochloa decumbens TaxID=240449 RepID=A0ABC9BXE4_9POAL